MSSPNTANDDGLFPAPPEESAVPPGIDRRSFLMRNAVIGAAAAMTGTTWTPEARARQAAKEAAQPKLGATMSPELDVVKRSKGPVMTVLEEFYVQVPCSSAAPSAR
jgi:L-serine dehydratase